MEAEKKKHIPRKQGINDMLGDKYKNITTRQEELGWGWEAQKMWQY